MAPGHRSDQDAQMTFRTRIEPKPTRKRVRRDDTRRTLMLNILFGLATFAALAMLAGVLFANWYGDHLAAIATVNGEQISKDAMRDRAAVDQARYDRQLRNLGQIRNMGIITTEEYSLLSNDLANNHPAASLHSDALDELTEEATLRQYADKHGISISDSQVDAQIAKEATIPEMRHVKVIAVEPVAIPPANTSTDAQLQAAQEKAQGWLDSIRSKSKTWDDISAQVNPYLNASGDLGLLKADDTQLDPDLMTAVFALKNVNDVTAVFESEDGLYRFATVTEIAAPFVDKDWQKAINSSAKADAYRAYARGQVVREAVKAAVLKDYLEKPTVQRQVREIALRQGYGNPGDSDEIAFRRMVFAPNHDTSTAWDLVNEVTTYAPDNPAWTEAKNRADAEAAKLRADPSQFDADARNASLNDDDQMWRTSGGMLPWIQRSIVVDASNGLGMPTLATALFDYKYEANAIVGPILESSQGYVVVEYLARRPSSEDRVAAVQLRLAKGDVFAAIARHYSEWPNARSGGDMGWVTRYQEDPEFESAIWQAPIGGTSRVCTQGGSGYWIFQVVAEETRLPDAKQAAKLQRDLFDNWFADLKAHTRIWTDSDGLQAIAPQAT
jgi:parvulin-like peptidyl-prolyl isomerase